MPANLFSYSRRLAGRLAQILPSSCALCAVRAEGVLCSPCEQRYFRHNGRRCSCCALPLAVATDVLCGQCMQQPRAFDATVTAVDYQPPIDQLVHGLKFSGQLAMAPLFARLLRDALLKNQNGTLPELLVAVPLGEQRLIERGYNQAMEIACLLSRSLGIAMAHGQPQRERETLAQALLHPDQRLSNMLGAFGMPAGAAAQLRGRHIGVVDDVMTTGATLEEMAATLKRAGAARVTNLVFARTPHKN
jgi:ComF family protein